MQFLRTIVFAAFAIPVCVTSASASDEPVISHAVQEQTLVACAARLGITGTIELRSVTATSPLNATSGNGVSVRQARRINSCAANTYVRMRPAARGTVKPVAASARPTQGVPADTYRGGKVGHDDSNRVVFSDYQCPPNFTGMFRGTLYCENGVMLR